MPKENRDTWGGSGKIILTFIGKSGESAEAGASSKSTPNKNENKKDAGDGFTNYSAIRDTIINYGNDNHDIIMIGLIIIILVILLSINCKKK